MRNVVHDVLVDVPINISNKNTISMKIEGGFIFILFLNAQ